MRDNQNSHVSQKMTVPIAARDQLTVYRLPPYPHELNPAERGLAAPQASLANLAKHSTGQLASLITTLLKRMRYRPASSPAPGLDPTPFRNLKN